MLVADFMRIEGPFLRQYCRNGKCVCNFLVARIVFPKTWLILYLAQCALYSFIERGLL